MLGSSKVTLFSLTIYDQRYGKFIQYTIIPLFWLTNVELSFCSRSTCFCTKMLTAESLEGNWIVGCNYAYATVTQGTDNKWGMRSRFCSWCWQTTSDTQTHTTACHYSLAHSKVFWILLLSPCELHLLVQLTEVLSVVAFLFFFTTRRTNSRQTWGGVVGLRVQVNHESQSELL